MVSQEFGININLKQNQILGRVIEKLAVAPVNPVIGQEYYNTINNKPYFWDGDLWRGYEEVKLPSDNLTINSNSNVVYFRRFKHTGTSKIINKDYLRIIN